MKKTPKLIWMLMSVLMLIFTSCGEKNVPVSSQENQQQDVVCQYDGAITLNQHTEIGRVDITNNFDGISISIPSVSPVDVNVIHVKVSTQLGNPGAPGQFPVHIENPSLPNVYQFNWSQFGLSYQPGQTLYYYIHFETNEGTAWAGYNCMRVGGNGNGNGKWICYIRGNTCE